MRGSHVIQSWFLLILFSLAVFRLTRLVVFDTITAPLRSLFHEEVEEKNEAGQVETYIVIKGKGLRAWIGELLSCYWCTGVWCTAFLLVFYALIPDVAEWLILLLAIAGLAGVMETIVSKWLS
ncbi:DUF1360 domain-containing protein [Bacillus sonorensis]|uniref:DUF1360 domain-containing protein n=1 Tax=Bacillus TaxID=1386 RepID=UPI0009D97DCB|nr:MULTISPECIES: DUF1360 domain-containing protein [Bacillus]MCF7619321.1 DUF1360 domain-containing protein [Bacillus sonorensis]MCY7855684.1 DUF1360 domain-containing protein [Bacillus sonorensis]MCY8025322.1 DUF1360 domain-containing protein [Bacillus sonorensis]MCY8032559.1 DUF1360 domain-containing protein [Bacillus sonorensis]MCY8087259.1 DUF1360 domain-containing protein [Bacillus sonorensis]